MSEAAKAARAAMKSKAARLTKADPSQKVDSSTWSPPEALDADVKTGARPLVKRLYKKGGKVIGKAAGEVSKARADRTARKSGGRIGKEAEDRSKRYLTPDNLINRDVRMANEAREGKKHVGAFKKGGKAFPDLTGDGKVTKADVLKGRGVIKTGGKVKKLGGGPIGDNPVSMQSREMGKAAGMMKKGGVAKKNHGGSMEQDRTPRNIPAQGGMVPASKAQWKRDLDADSRPAAPTKSPDYPDKAQSLPRKKGGKVANWEGSKKDEAQDRMLAKKYGISMKQWEKSAKDKKHDKQQSMEGLKHGGRSKKEDGGSAGSKKMRHTVQDSSYYARDPFSNQFEENLLQERWNKSNPYAAKQMMLDKENINKSMTSSGLKKGGRTKKYSGGGVFSGDSLTKIPGAVGGRHAHATKGAVSDTRKRFNEEFRKNREAGNATFEFDGKTYTTDLAKSAPMPAPRPSAPMAQPSGNRAPEYDYQRPEMHTEHGLFIGRQGQPAIVFQREVPGPAPVREQPNVTYGGGQYGPSSDPASRIAAPAPAPAQDPRMNRGQPSHTEYGLFGGRPGAYGEKAINFSREVPDYPASSFLPRKSGGRAKGKGKTNINIVIAAGRHLGDQPAPNAPVPMPKAMPQMPPMPPMPPQGMPPMPPAGGPQDMPMPMPRKSGGRTVHVIDHAAGGGLGRMEKIKAYGHKAGKVVGKK